MYANVLPRLLLQELISVSTIVVTVVIVQPNNFFAFSHSFIRPSRSTGTTQCNSVTK